MSYCKSVVKVVIQRKLFSLMKVTSLPPQLVFLMWEIHSVAYHFVYKMTHKGNDTTVQKPERPQPWTWKWALNECFLREVWPGFGVLFPLQCIFPPEMKEDCTLDRNGMEHPWKWGLKPPCLSTTVTFILQDKSRILLAQGSKTTLELWRPQTSQIKFCVQNLDSYRCLACQPCTKHLLRVKIHT